tara:strand:- start:1094 stop:2044 length:951 start_codon:yes stop_codon:yes gene_type:complete
MVEISVIVPVYNEEENIDVFVNSVEKVFQKLSKTYEIIFILDPSKDKTEEKILNQIKKNKNIKLLILSRKFGQPISTIAGIENANGNYCVVIDVDLQDPPELIEEMYNKIKIENLDVVFAVRKSREGETFIKKMISNLGYKIINYMSDVAIPTNAGDFRIFSRRVVNELKKFNDKDAFLRGMVSYVGFKQSKIYFDRKERSFGKSKYNKFTGSLRIGINGIVGFSSRPLFLMTISGFVIALLSFLIALWYFIQKIAGVLITPGVPTIVVLISFYSGIQLIGMGILGEYIGRIYNEVKQRPKYILDKKINFENDLDE